MGRQDTLREQDVKFLSKAVPLLDCVVPIIDDVGAWLAKELAQSAPAPGAASDLARLEDETTKFLREWQRLKPPGRFRQPWELYQVVFCDLREMLQSTPEALHKEDVRLIAQEPEVSLARYRADLQTAIRAHDQLRLNVRQALGAVSFLGRRPDDTVPK
jgi:hypothetical protein